MSRYSVIFLRPYGSPGCQNITDYRDTAALNNIISALAICRAFEFLFKLWVVETSKWNFKNSWNKRNLFSVSPHGGLGILSMWHWQVALKLKVWSSPHNLGELICQSFFSVSASVALDGMAADSEIEKHRLTKMTWGLFWNLYGIFLNYCLCGTNTSVMVVERHLPGSSHHDPSLVNREEEVTTCAIRPCDSVCPDYFVKTSKNEFFKISEGRLCYWALYFYFATVCTDFSFLTYYSSSLIITLRFQNISLFLDVSFFRSKFLFYSFFWSALFLNRTVSRDPLDQVFNYLLGNPSNNKKQTKQLIPNDNCTGFIVNELLPGGGKYTSHTTTKSEFRFTGIVGSTPLSPLYPCAPSGPRAPFLPPDPCSPLGPFMKVNATKTFHYAGIIVITMGVSVFLFEIH